MNTQLLSDQVLLNRYLSGDRSAISQLIDRHSARVRDYIRMMVKDRDVADDILQETLIKVVRVIDEGLPIARITPVMIPGRAEGRRIVLIIYHFVAPIPSAPLL